MLHVEGYANLQYSMNTGVARVKAAIQDLQEYCNSVVWGAFNCKLLKVRVNFTKKRRWQTGIDVVGRLVVSFEGYQSLQVPLQPSGIKLSLLSHNWLGLRCWQILQHWYEWLQWLSPPIHVFRFSSAETIQSNLTQKTEWRALLYIESNASDGQRGM